jgi:AcrR family transcriptional regulator
MTARKASAGVAADSSAQSADRAKRLAPRATTSPATAEHQPAVPGRRSRKREETAGRLVDVAFELFARYGYEPVTMEQIAAAADVAKGTLYNHFPVKEALLSHRFHGQLAAAMPAVFAELAQLPSSLARLHVFLHRSAEFAERSREYMAPYLHYRLSRPVDSLGRDNRSGLDQIYARLLADGQASGEIRADLPAQRLADSLAFSHLGTLLYWLRTPGSSLAAEFDAMLDLFLAGAGGTDVQPPVAAAPRQTRGSAARKAASGRSK